VHRFTSTVTAVEEISALQEGKLAKGLKQFLSQEIVDKGKGKESLLVSEGKLGHYSLSFLIFLYLTLIRAGKGIQKKLDIHVISDSTTNELFRGIRSQLASLLDGINPDDLATMSLGLSHSLSRWALFMSGLDARTYQLFLKVQAKVFSRQGGHNGHSVHCALG